ncbi:MAG: hypothetical protein ACLSHC_18785 [Bilophila wadsworthia]
MKKLLVACLLCASVIGLAFGQAKAASKTTVIVASSVDANPQNYTNVFYNKFIELAQQYSDNAFDFQFFPYAFRRQETARSSSAPSHRHLATTTMPARFPRWVADN